MGLEARDSTAQVGYQIEGINVSYVSGGCRPKRQSLKLIPIQGWDSQAELTVRNGSVSGCVRTEI
jgi:hypothetical protein